MKKIPNPWIGIDGYLCFGCAPANTHGLQMEFFEDGDEIVCVWEPKPQFQGWLNTLHGGIQSVLMDEIAAWVVVVKLQICGVTSKIETKFLKPIYTNKGKLTIKAHLLETKRNIAFVSCEIYNEDNELCSSGIITYFTYSQEQSKALFNFVATN
ncbi:MAG: PaaI family thioesterase [Paludibacteraceae bacterium]|nr:PaaI family thioesterase [Paludibacteraceae bacterium]MBN2787756.1 PaaI family thioesterase [Paludibacteraceae bacterium]